MLETANPVKVSLEKKLSDVESFLNFKMLEELLLMKSISKSESIVINYVIPVLDSLGFRMLIDSMGNIMACRGESDYYALLNAHMDIVELRSKFSYSSGNSYTDFKWKNSLSETKKSDKTGSETAADVSWGAEDLRDYSLQVLGKSFNCIDCKYLISCSSCRTLCRSFSPETVYKDVAEKLEKFFKSHKSKPQKKQSSIVKESSCKKNSDYSAFKEKEVELPYEVYVENGLIRGRTAGNVKRVLGGDDKCGIFVALEVARLLPEMPMKILFTCQEEIGCYGIKEIEKSNSQWFKDCKYSITIDRKEGSHLLWSQHGVRSCSNEFAAMLSRVGISLGIPVAVQDGKTADVCTIRKFVRDSVNISAGYYNPHTESEYINIGELESIALWVGTALKNM